MPYGTCKRIADSGKETKDQPTQAVNEPDTGEKSRYDIVISEWDYKTGGFIDTTSSIEKDTQYGPQQKLDKAFIFRRVTNMSRILRNEGTDPSYSEVEVIFPELQTLLGRLTFKWGWAERVTKCRSPYDALIYAWDEAQEEAVRIVEDESPEEQWARNDLKELLKIISTKSGDARLDAYLRNRKTLQNEKTITHDSLWTLFPPGKLVVGKPCNDEPQIFFVESCERFVKDGDSFEAVCYSYDWNGLTFERVPFSMTIDTWAGDRKSIIELPFYPLEFYREKHADNPELELNSEESIKSLKNRLIERGKRYVGFCTAKKGKQMVNYAGAAYMHRSPTFLHPQDTDRDGHWRTRRSNRSRDSSSEEDTRRAANSVGGGWRPVCPSLDLLDE